VENHPNIDIVKKMGNRPLNWLRDWIAIPEPFNKGEPVHIKAWFHPDVARYIKEKIWHGSQKIHQQDHGSIIFEAEVAGTDEIRFWIMTWGSKADVLEPEPLREELMAEAERMLKRYQKDVEREERDDAFNLRG